jgi:hypothetical protein
MSGLFEESIKGIREFFEDFWEEISDFWEDFIEHLLKKKPSPIKKIKKVRLYGTPVSVRPAYVFAERVESGLKIIFGFSILISGVIASFWGMTQLSELLKTLISTLIGRIVMSVIGLSYLVLGLWKILHLEE